MALFRFLLLSDVMCVIPTIIYYLYASRPHMTVPIPTPLLVCARVVIHQCRQLQVAETSDLIQLTWPFQQVSDISLTPRATIPCMH